MNRDTRIAEAFDERPKRLKPEFDRPRMFLVTGASGFLGSHLTAALLARGHRVTALCRPGRGLSPHARMARLAAWLDIRPDARTRLEVCEGEIERPRLGLDKADALRLADRVETVLHCAADTSFAARHRARVERSNLAGLNHVLDFAREAGCPDFHHMSTAYVAGKSSGLCREDLESVESFHNVYEETKHKAEQMAAAAARETGMRLFIYRPAVVYGDSRTGRSLSFNALYYPVKVAWRLLQLYRKDLKDNRGVRMAELGIRPGKDGRIHLPIRLEKDGPGLINLVPVDFFVAACMAVMEERSEGGVFHIVNPRPTTLERLIDYASSWLKVTGIRAVGGEAFDRESRNPLETLMAGYLEIYAPYMRDRRRFDASRTDAVLRSRNLECPDLTYESFSRCMEYAAGTDWGKKGDAGLAPVGMENRRDGCP